MKVKTLLGLTTMALVMALGVATVSAVQSNPALLSNVRATVPETGNSLFYGRTSIDGVVRYVTYGGEKTLTLTDNPAEALYDIEFIDSTNVKIKCGELYLGYVDESPSTSTTDLSNTETIWTLTNGQVKVNDVKGETTTERTLGFRTSTYNTGKAYANIDNDEFFQIYFYTQEEFDARKDVCNWGLERRTNLTNLIFEVPAPITRYTISFNANGGSGTMNSVEVAEGKQYTLPGNAFTAPSGQRFKCWRIDETDRAVGYKLTVTGNVTLIAQWEDIPAELPNPIIFSTLGLSNGVQYTDPFEGNGFTVTFAGGSNDGKYYTTGAGIRVYGDGTMTITTTDKNIVEITITYDGSYKPTSTDVVNVGAYVVDTGVWTGDAAEVVFTRPSGSGHWRVKSIAVTFKN